MYQLLKLIKKRVYFFQFPTFLLTKLLRKEIGPWNLEPDRDKKQNSHPKDCVEMIPWLKWVFLIHFFSANHGHREISQLFLRLRNVWCRSDHRPSQSRLWPMCWSSWIWSRYDLTIFFYNMCWDFSQLHFFTFFSQAGFKNIFQNYAYIICLF